MVHDDWWLVHVAINPYNATRIVKEALMPDLNGPALVRFTELAKAGYTVRYIRGAMSEEGFDLTEHSDTDLVKLLRHILQGENSG